MIYLKDQLKAMQAAALEAVAAAQSNADLEALRVKYLGKKGEVTAILKQMGKLDAEMRPVIGALANEVRQTLETSLEEAKAVAEEAGYKVIKEGFGTAEHQLHLRTAGQLL